MKKAARTSGKSEGEIARRLGEAESKLNRYLNAGTIPKISWIARFAEAADTTVETIMADADLLPKVDMADALAKDPSLAPVYRKLVRNTYEDAVELSKDIGLERSLRR